MKRSSGFLRTLLCRVLRMSTEAPPRLVDVVVDRDRGVRRPELRLHFSNGHCDRAELRPADWYAFCERHAAWRPERFERALAREAHRIYSAMRRKRLAERGRPGARSGRSSTVSQVSRSDSPAMGSTNAHSPSPPPPPSSRPVRENFESRCESQVEHGNRLLNAHLTSFQREQLSHFGYFEVQGGESGKRYRIRMGISMNVDELDERGEQICKWCFLPEGRLVVGDVMLAQKVALECFERGALCVANRHGAPATPMDIDRLRWLHLNNFHEP